MTAGTAFLGAPDGPALLRTARDEDDEAIARLVAASPDGGAVGFAPEQHVPSRLALAASHAQATTVVAQLPDGAIVGAAGVSVGECRVQDEVRDYALLHSLVVHPSQRRRGIGGGLTRWRLDRADALIGENGLVLANIQQGNEASAANARGWATWTSPPAVTAPVPMRRRPPSDVPIARLGLGQAETNELEEIADGIARFSGRTNFSVPWTASSLRHWLDSSPFVDPINHYLVARDRAGRILAGFGMREEGRVRSLRLTRVPRPIRMADSVLHLLPSDGVLRNLTVDKLWFAPGASGAARALWEDTRWRWRDRGTNLLATLDPRSPAMAVLQLRPWSPTTRMSVAVRGHDAALSTRRLIEPIL